MFQWETVKYFDNKIICDLIEEKHKGIISILVGEMRDVISKEHSAVLGKDQINHANNCRMKNA